MAVTAEESQRAQRESGFQYAACYCEENVHRLCGALRERGLSAGDDLFVVFVSNAARAVPFWRQRSNARADGFCVWDYHVLCVQRGGVDGDALVWDLDAALPCPVALREYAREALRPSALRRLFRVVAAPFYLRFFASDRRHMRAGEGRWLAPPPPWSCIVAEDGEAHNLQEYITMEEETAAVGDPDAALAKVAGERFGAVLVQERFLELFDCRSTAGPDTTSPGEQSQKSEVQNPNPSR